MQHTITLSEAELRLLDGNASDQVQALIDRIDRRDDLLHMYGAALNEQQAWFVLGVVDHATQHGSLTWKLMDEDPCDLCDGHRSPLVDLADRRVYALRGVCVKCILSLREVIADQVAGLIAQIPWQLTGLANANRRHDTVRCDQCQWQGSRQQLKMIEGVMGPRFPGQCPHCDARARIGSNPFTKVDELFSIEYRDPQQATVERLADALKISYSQKPSRTKRAQDMLALIKALAKADADVRPVDATILASASKITKPRFRDARYHLEALDMLMELPGQQILANPVVHSITPAKLLKLL